ncbi:DUF932 domain-containing protein, partial [Klebsiella pneumoniae]
MRLASRFGLTHSIRQERPLTNDELVKVVPSVFSEEKHNSRSDRYTYIPTITLLDKLREEGFQPFFACQSRVRDEDKRGHTKHMVRLRREGANKGTEVPEIILLNSHDGSSSYQMIPGMFRFVCTNGLVCGTSFGEIRVPHKGDIVGRVMEGANKQVISSQADSLIKISRIWADFFSRKHIESAYLGYFFHHFWRYFRFLLRSLPLT